MTHYGNQTGKDNAIRLRYGKPDGTIVSKKYVAEVPDCITCNRKTSKNSYPYMASKCQAICGIG